MARLLTAAFLFCILAHVNARRTDMSDTNHELEVMEEDEYEHVSSGYADCTVAAKELYRGAKNREMTQLSCARASIVMQELTHNATSCHWAYACEGKKDLGFPTDVNVCWNANTFAVGVCLNDQAADAEEEEEKDVVDDKDVSSYFGMTVATLGEEELSQQEDPLLKPAPEGKPWARACCKVCKKGLACGHSCISRRKSCSKDLGCACQGL
mmetsp:Transcript_15788/g.28765  ORF Transcript_15788/g.28765 Transcript_15788/m.28765 type:complete len:211 (+) Transcript_15788:76-708(+)